MIWYLQELIFNNLMTNYFPTAKNYEDPRFFHTNWPFFSSFQRQIFNNMTNRLWMSTWQYLSKNYRKSILKTKPPSLHSTNNPIPENFAACIFCSFCVCSFCKFLKLLALHCLHCLNPSFLQDHWPNPWNKHKYFMISDDLRCIWTLLLIGSGIFQLQPSAFMVFPSCWD